MKYLIFAYSAHFTPGAAAEFKGFKETMEEVNAFIEEQKNPDTSYGHDFIDIFCLEEKEVHHHSLKRTRMSGKEPQIMRIESTGAFKK
jgi:hypothetical protein